MQIGDKVIVENWVASYGYFNNVSYGTVCEVVGIASSRSVVVKCIHSNARSVIGQKRTVSKSKLTVIGRVEKNILTFIKGELQ